MKCAVNRHSELTQDRNSEISKTSRACKTGCDCSVHVALAVNGRMASEMQYAPDTLSGQNP